MSLYDLYKQHHSDKWEGWVEVDGVWQCPECGTESDNCLYNNDDGVVGRICKDHPDATIFIGSGRA